MPTSPAGHPLIALKAELGKAVLLFKVSLIAAVDVIPPVDSFYAVNSGKSIISQSLTNEECKKYKRLTYPSPLHNLI